MKTIELIVSPEGQVRLETRGFSGAGCLEAGEYLRQSLGKIVRESKTLSEAARNVVPVSVTSVESVESLRDWASGRCLSADAPGIYQRLAKRSSRRKVTPSPSAN